MDVSPSEFTRRVDLVNYTYVTGDSGGNSIALVDSISTWAKVEQKGGSMSANQAQMMADATYQVTIRYRSQVTQNWNIVYEGQIFMINKIVFDNPAYKRFMIIDCAVSISLAAQYVPGIPVPIQSSDSSIVNGIAGETLGGGKLVYLSGDKFYLYDANDVSLADMAFGMTMTAAGLNEAVSVKITGVFTEAGLGLIPNEEYYADVNGLLTNLPTNTVITSVGIAVTADKIKIEIQPSIITV